MLNARTIFNGNLVNFSNIVGTPKSADAFRKTYIEPLFAELEREREGKAIDEAFGEVVADYQRDGFIVGFNAAVQLIMNCMEGGK